MAGLGHLQPISEPSIALLPIGDVMAGASNFQRPVSLPAESGQRPVFTVILGESPEPLAPASRYRTGAAPAVVVKERTQVLWFSARDRAELAMLLDGDDHDVCAL